MIPKAGDREKVFVVSTYTPPRPQKWDGEGGGKQSVGLASKPREGKALHRHRKYGTQYSNSRRCVMGYVLLPGLDLILRASHTSRASQSSTSLAGSHLSPSGPSPCHRTRYCVCFARRRSSTILSMKNSCSPSQMIGAGGCNARCGKRSSSFSLNGKTSDVWKTGNVCGELGR